jgi:hypothetical protein
MLVGIRKGGAGWIHQVANKQRLPIRGAANKTCSEQEVRIKIPVERAEMPSKCSAFHQNACGKAKNGAPQFADH